MPEQGKQPNETPTGIDGERIISYNFSEDQRPGGMKVRAKVRVVTGREAEAVNRAQAEAIRELLLWVRQQRRNSPPQEQ